MHLRLLSLGFGNVGRALAAMLAEKADEVRDRYDLTLSFAGIVTRSTGPVLFDEDVSAAHLVASAWPAGTTGAPVTPLLSDVLALIRQCPADVVLELTPLNPHSGQPAVDHIRAALDTGKHVVTANKGPIAYAYRELRALARERGVALRFESTVMDGAPIFGMAEAALPATAIHSLRGVLNSTSNYVLSRMAAGESLEQAVASAQRLGVAEADPSYDLDGWDGAVKATVLANVLMDADLRPGDVERAGLGADAMRAAHAALRPGETLKQLVVVGRTAQNENVRAQVRLAALPSADVFAHLSGMETALMLRTDTMGDLTLVEGEGGPGQTAFGVVADLVNIARQYNPRISDR